MKPCPFCGKRPKILKEKNRLEYFVGCLNTKCPVLPVPFMVYRTKKQAVQAWDTRPKEMKNAKKDRKSR